MSTFRWYFLALLGTFFLKVSLNKIVMRKMILVPCFDDDRPFPKKYTVKDHISNTKLAEGDHYYIQTRHKDLFSHYNLILRKL